MNKRKKREAEMVAAIGTVADVPIIDGKKNVVETQDFIAEIFEITETLVDPEDRVDGTVLWTFVGSEWADLTPIEKARATRYNYEIGVYHSSKEPSYARDIADDVQDALVPLGFVTLGEISKLNNSAHVATIRFAMTV